MKFIAHLLAAAAMLGGFGRVLTEAPAPRVNPLATLGSSYDYGSGINIGAIEYARRHNRRGKIVRRNRGN
jgi:hypothetical protein